MKMFGFTVRYFPFPHPMSSPIDPAGRSLRNCSTMGQGCGKDQLGSSFAQKLPDAVSWMFERLQAFLGKGPASF